MAFKLLADGKPRYQKVKVYELIPAARENDSRFDLGGRDFGELAIRHTQNRNVMNYYSTRL